MVKEFKHLELLGHRVFDKAIIKAPFRMIAKMPNEACFYFLLKGSAKVNTPTKELNLATEEGLVMQCGNYLNDYILEDHIEYCEAIAIHLYPEILKEVYESEIPDFLSNKDKVAPMAYKKYNSSDLMTNYINGLKFYFDHPHLVSDELLKLKIKELIILLANTNNLKTIKDMFSRMFSVQRYAFQEIIEANLYNDVGIQELAALTNLSLSSFKRKFAQHYECPPARYLKEKKLKKATKMLKGTDLTVTEIAYSCGFNDLANFSRLFTKSHGVSPSKYRLSHLA